MSEISCTYCGVKLENDEAAYGLTSGRIDDDLEGFCMNLDNEWDIYCPNCMNTIDKLISDSKCRKETL